MVQFWERFPVFSLEVTGVFCLLPPPTVDQIYHLASPASPPNYMYNPIKTLKTNTIGTLNMLGESAPRPADGQGVGTRSLIPTVLFLHVLACFQGDWICRHDSSWGSVTV